MMFLCFGVAANGRVVAAQNIQAGTPEAARDAACSMWRDNTEVVGVDVSRNGTIVLESACKATPARS